MIFIGGATASGKTSISIELAKRLNGEIISADSMQVYKYMNVGTAKATKEEQCGIVHHMIDIVDPHDSYSVAEYQEQARRIIVDVKQRNKVPIIVGGTGLYVNSLLYDYHPSARDEGLREQLKQELNQYGIDYMYTKLLELDPKSAENIHKNNVKRVLRALEVIILTGESMADKRDKEKPYPHLMYAVNMERETLYERINKRVDMMFDNGLKEEVNYLVNDLGVNFDCQSMQAIGYKEFRDYMAGEIEENTLKELIKQHSRNYAKRQQTWFKSIESCVWIKNEEKESICNKIIKDYSNYRAKLQ